MNAGESRHRSAGAEQADALAIFGEHGREIGEGTARALAHSEVSFDPVRPFELLLALALGQRDHSPGRAPPGLDLGSAIALINENQLGRSSANIENQRRPIARL